MIKTELDSIVNQYTDKFCNPMVIWGKYRKHWFKTTLPILASSCLIRHQEAFTLAMQGFFVWQEYC